MDDDLDKRIWTRMLAEKLIGGKTELGYNPIENHDTTLPVSVWSRGLASWGTPSSRGGPALVDQMKVVEIGE